jgi:hypothetical protein
MLITATVLISTADYLIGHSSTALSKHLSWSCSSTGEVTHIVIPRTFVVLPELDGCSFPLTVITGL